MELADRLDLDFGIEHARLELDVLEPVERDHPLHLADQRLRRERLAILVGPGVRPFAAAARMLVERVGREGDLVADAAAEEVADRLLQRPAAEVERGDLERRVEALLHVERVLAGHVEGLRAVEARSLHVAFDEVDQESREAEGVGAEDAALERLEALRDRVAPVGLGDAGDLLVAHELQDRAERVRLVQSVGAPQRRVGDGDRVDLQIDDFHAGRSLGSRRSETVTATPIMHAASTCRPLE